MRYAVFTDIHANLEALEAVLEKIDEIAKEDPIDGIWFLGDLVGYGPNPNECIDTIRARTDVIIAGNHDWAAVGKIDVEDFSEAARLSAEWTAEELTEEHREFLLNLPETLQQGDCYLAHGSPFGPLWEYLTSEVLAERSFQYFKTRFCFVGHTHVPVIFQQPDITATPTIPLANDIEDLLNSLDDEDLILVSDDDEETTKLVALTPSLPDEDADTESKTDTSTSEATENEGEPEEAPAIPLDEDADSENELILSPHSTSDPETQIDPRPTSASMTPEDEINKAEERFNAEMEELLALLGLSQSMMQVTNEMVIPPEGEWLAPEGFRCIVNPGGVGQPRDNDPRAAFMIYDTEKGFSFYRIPYSLEKTQEKILKAGLPPYLATRLAFGR